MKKIVSAFLVISFLSSCNWFDEKEYVLVQVINNTYETIQVETGLDFVAIDILSNQSATLSIVKAVPVSVTGKTSGYTYSTKTFYRDGYWTIN